MRMKSNRSKPNKTHGRGTLCNEIKKNIKLTMI